MKETDSLNLLLYFESCAVMLNEDGPALASYLKLDLGLSYLNFSNELNVFLQIFFNLCESTPGNQSRGFIPRCLGLISAVFC